MTHQLAGAISPDYVDKRRIYRDDFETRIVTGAAAFTANATGTTTTIVGANASPGTGVNVARLDDEFKLFTAAGVLKEEKTFRVTGIAVAGSTTVTYTPASAVAPVSGDFYKLAGLQNQSSTGEMDRRLVALGFSALFVSKLSENDKQYQLRTSDDPGSI